MSSEEFLFLLVSAYALKKQRRRKHRWWQRQFLSNRETLGAHTMLINELTLEDGSSFKNYVRMSPSDFEHLLTLVAPLISKKDTKFRKAISPADQLAVTLRFLATGDSFSSLMYMHRISKSAISEIIGRVCEALISVLSKEIKLPQTEEEWNEISAGFQLKWNFPHCLGAIDGKHIELEAPMNSGTTYFNYKQTHSIVLLAVVDADYRFIFANVGIQGRISDGGVLKYTTFYEKLLRKQLNIPQPAPLPGRTKSSPFVFVADDAFGLEENIIKPFPGHHPVNSWKRIFNYRLSRARRIVENVFGILTAVFRVLRKRMELNPKKATSVTLAAVYLHNFLRNRKSAQYTPPGSFDSEDDNGNVIPGSWRTVNRAGVPLQPLFNSGGRTSSTLDNRNEFGEYFCSISGSLPWQYNRQ